jgi:HlyD family secretion protein
MMKALIRVEGEAVRTDGGLPRLHDDRRAEYTRRDEHTLVLGNQPHPSTPPVTWRSTSMEVDPDVITIAPPWARTLLYVCCSVLLTAVAFCVFGKVEQTGTARGIVQFAGGSHTLASQATGVVSEVKVGPGDRVEEGQPIVTLDSAAGAAALLEAERGVTRAQAMMNDFRLVEKPLVGRQQAQLERRVAILRARVGSQVATSQRLRGKEETYRRLEQAGLASTLDRGAVNEEVAASTREHLRVEDDIAQTEIAATNLAREAEAKELLLSNQLREATDHRDSVKLGVAQNAVLAPRAGRVDSVVVKSGDTLTPGTAVARILPLDAPLQVVAFAPDADRGFLESGMEARVELDQFPPSEFGWVSVKVARVSSDLASKAEVKNAFGDFTNEETTGPVHGVTFNLVPGQTSAELRTRVGAGSMVTARYVLRRERLIFLLSEPLRRMWE